MNNQIQHCRKPQRLCRIGVLWAGIACLLIVSCSGKPALPDNDTIKPLIRELCQTLKNKGELQAAAIVAAYPYGIDGQQHKEIAMRLLTATLLPGTKAPAIAGVTTNDSKHNSTILLFHESACRTCGRMIRDLEKHYGELQNTGVRVITVSTDTDKKAFAEYSEGLPWPDKLCDYRGFYSPTMESYGVAATPTLFLLDKNGVVAGQYGTLEEVWNILFAASEEKTLK